MKNLFSFIALISLCVVFGGCPYESAIPIDEPSVNINKKLLGTWYDSSNSDESYQVSNLNDFTYSIVTTDAQTQESANYLAYASVINETTFLNLWEIKPNESSHSFSLYKMEVLNDHSVAIVEVTENIDELFATSKELRKYVAANMKNSYFFGKNEINLIR